MMRILLAIDGSICSDAAVAEVGRRPWPEGSELKILTVDEPLHSDFLQGASTTLYDQMVREERAAVHRRLDEAFMRLKRALPDVKVSAQLKEGHAKDVILDESDDWGADLIVIGSRGHGAFRRMVLGSVSLAIATNSRCSVEIVRVRPQVEN